MLPPLLLVASSVALARMLTLCTCEVGVKREGREREGKAKREGRGIHGGAGKAVGRGGSGRKKVQGRRRWRTKGERTENGKRKGK